jgi:hypothetical protein
MPDNFLINAAGCGGLPAALKCNCRYSFLTPSSQKALPARHVAKLVVMAAGCIIFWAASRFRRMICSESFCFRAGQAYKTGLETVQSNAALISRTVSAILEITCWI